MDTPFLSIIIPLYNKEQTIFNTLKAVLEQPFKDYEILIIDDGSTDKSLERVRSLRDSRIRVVSKTNGGPSSARNVGIKEAVGKYVYFIDADDTLLPDALSTIANTIRKNSKFNIFTFNFYIKDKNRRFLYSDNYCNGIVKTPFLRWLLKSFFANPGSFVCKNVLLKHYQFVEQHRRYEDVEFFFKIIRENTIFANPDPIFEYNQESLAASLPRSDYREDFCCSMEPSGKPFWEQVCLYGLYLEAQSLYPDIIKQLYDKKFEKLRYRIAYSLVMRYLTYKWKFKTKASNKNKKTEW